MLLLDEVLEANRVFVEQNGRNPHKEAKTPKRKVAIFTCMDTRLVELLEPAMGINRGDAHVIKNAGNTLLDPQGGIIRSLVVSIFVLGVQEVLVVGHRDCGMAGLSGDKLESAMLARGVPPEAIAQVEGLHEWVGAFADPADNVRQVVGRLRNNPLIPTDVPVHGLIIEPNSGTLSVIVSGYQ